METPRKNQTKNIKLFLKLVNNDKVIYSSPTDLTVYAMDYFDLLEAFGDKMPFLTNLSEKRQKTITIINSSDKKEFEEIKKIFVYLRDGVRKQFDAVLKGKKSMPKLISRKGSFNVYADLEQDAFTSFFEPEKISDKLELETEIKLFEIVMESILVGYNKKPSQLKVCDKKGCGNLFFKFSEGSMYCSTRCSNAVAQQNFKGRQK